MGGVRHCIPTRYPKLIPPPISIPRASARRDHQIPTPVQEKKSKRRLIKISTSDGRWHGKWNCDYTFSLKELQLHDLSDEDIHKDANVFISLCLNKHAGLGLSIEGRIVTCFARKCYNCCSPYLREINTTFKVWILPSTRRIRDSSRDQLPIIGDDDPSVIYVQPGCETYLDSLIHDTIRLASSVKETCSESCEESEPKLLYLGARNVASTEKMWYKLLEIKKKHDFMKM